MMRVLLLLLCSYRLDILVETKRDDGDREASNPRACLDARSDVISISVFAEYSFQLSLSLSRKTQKRARREIKKIRKYRNRHPRARVRAFLITRPNGR